MPKSPKEIKLAYFKRVYAKAPYVKCKCGCGTSIKNKDKYGRDKVYINGHNAKKFEDPNQASRNWNHRNRDKRQQYKKKYHRTRKRALLNEKGNKCEDCSIKYDGTNACIFHFHHIKSKSFDIGNQVINKSWNALIKELDKCILLCANCHEKRHSGEF